MSIFASNKPVPKAETIADTVSTDMYDKEQRVGSIPSLTLRPDGKERSVMSLHFPGVWPLGTTPSWLHCTSRATLSGRGPRIRLSLCSLVMKADTTSGWATAEGIFAEAESRGCDRVKPIWKPDEMPSTRYFRRRGSG